VVRPKAKKHVSYEVLTVDSFDFPVHTGSSDGVRDLIARIEAVCEHRGLSHWQLAKMAHIKLDSLQRMLAIGAYAGWEPFKVRFETVVAVLSVLGLEIDLAIRIERE